ncbi:hypothetical protein LOTGIDRAFT_205137 [Lottia gigantea]|uniref:Apoptosis regulatory protein Siva n=1 Tax=Lottia gigantea TaxID=225164 RepID=V4ACC4_LOTGI|nr:hypothetical protein LOTGIDRAFT_205137 [Lottia gigantea]ESP01654.1 hypothetical protein LOTGIDRAFT_205137 [Lottia gigantea]
MPKRSNPFGDSSPLQFKTHVGKKEVDMGVSRDENMKEVYEKTKEMLFKGAQKQYEIDANANQIGWQMDVDADLGVEPLPGQMCFDKNGQLTIAPTLSQQNSTDSMMPAVSVPSKFQFSDSSSTNVPANACCHCRKPFSQQTFSTRCYFCDKRLCFPCTRNCDKCNEKFCQMCSLLNYDEAFERAFCFNCIP